MSIESAYLYIAKAKNQRAADLGNLAAGATSSPLVGGLASTTAIATAANVVAINGLTDATVTTVGVPSPKTPSTTALSTTVLRNMPRLFRGLIGTGTSSPVVGTSIVSIGSSTGDACLASLLGPIRTYGSSSVTGPACGASAATYLYVCGTATFAMRQVSVGYSSAREAAFLCSSASISPASADFSYKSTISDTIAAKADIVAIKAHLTAMGNPGWPYGTKSPGAIKNPSVTTGADKTYANIAAVLPQSTKYGTLTLTDANLVFNGTGAADPDCANPTTMSGNIILNGTNTLAFGSGCYVVAGYVLAKNGANANFTVAQGANVTFVFKKYIKNDSGTLSFPSATYSINGSIINTDDGNMIFGSGSKVFDSNITNGSGSLTIASGPHYLNGGTIVNGSGTLAFGDGAFYLWGGSIDNAKSGIMNYGNGPFTFYGGSVINDSGSLIFGNGPFYFYGGSVDLNKNSTTRFGVGNMDFYGGSISMGGLSTTFGYGGSATSGSSTVSFYGGSLSLTSQNLTAVGVTFGFLGGSQSFLGVGTINATAPTTQNPTYGYRNILLVTFGGALSLYQSSSVTDTMSGLIYVPDSTASLYGSQTINYPTGGCFQLVAGVVNIYQNARVNFAPCAGLAIQSSASAAVLIQ